MSRMHRRASLLSFGSAALALATALVAGSAVAQDQQAPPATDAAPADAAPADVAVAEDELIIVTGTAGGGISRQDAAFALTTVDSDAIDRIAPTSTADLFRVIPGVSAESSGGQNGANIFVRGYPSGGDAEYVTLQTEGVPFFPPSTLSFLENTQLIRIDETLERIEAVRGGTGALFSSGQPGLTINFVQKKGGRDFAGLAKFSATDFGELRGDAYVSGPLGPNTSFLVGGYYAASDGIRDAEFTAEKGGQISANIVQRFDRGSLLVFGRYLDDRGQWLLPIPVIQDGDKIREFPGFDAGTGTFAGRGTRRAVLNDGTRADLADGRGAKLYNFGFNFDYEIADGFTLRDRASYLNGDADTTGLVPAGAAPQTAASFAAGYGTPGSPASIGSLRFVDGGGAVAADQQVIQVGFWVVRKDIEALVNDFSLEFQSGNNTLTGGVYYSAYYSDDRWNLGNGQLLTAEPNARRLDLVLADGRQATRDGFAQGSFFNVNASYGGEDVALYAVDEFQFSPEFRVDGGIRWQRHSVDGTLENNSFGVDTDNNPATLFNNGTAVLNGTFSSIRYRGEEFSWTAGANYEFTPDVGLFARYSRGHAFPFFDNLRDGNRLTQEVDSYEAGLKLSTDFLSAYATVFHNEFSGLTTTVITGGAPIASVGGAKTTGVELEGALRPFGGLAIGFGGTWLDAQYEDFFADGGATDLTGNQVQRQPEWQWRVTPSYEAEFGRSKATVFTTIAYTGDRFSDVQNQQTLPSYYKWDAGILVDINERFQLQATVDNINDEIGLTEGNPRVIGAQGAGAILARPILGRSFRFSAGIAF